MMNLQKPKRYESENYKNFIRNLPCCVPGCNRRRNSKNNKRQVDPHHTKSRGAGGSDLTCAPLSDDHHSELHTIGQNTFQKKYNIDFKDIQIDCMQKFIEERLS